MFIHAVFIIGVLKYDSLIIIYHLLVQLHKWNLDTIDCISRTSVILCFSNCFNSSKLSLLNINNGFPLVAQECYEDFTNEPQSQSHTYYKNSRKILQSRSLNK